MTGGKKMTQQQGNVYAPTEVRLDDIVTPGEYEIAGRGTRLGAVILDGVMFAVAGMLAAVMIPAFSNNESAQVVAISLVGVAMLGLLMLNIVFLHQNGQTIGKKILGIKVVRMSGERIGVLRIFFLRYLPVTLLGAIPYLGWAISLTDSLLIFRESNQCLHDTIADTIVIKA
jgi:uncharacterized RDD family membrane protein YckC